MEFERVSRKQRRRISGNAKCFLIEDNWNDFGFYTTFSLVYFDADGIRLDLGVVKIMQFGMDAQVEVPELFEQLSDKYCSLGSGQEFYEAVCDIPNPTRDEILLGLRDCVAEQERYERFADEEPMKVSLLRSNSKKNVTKLLSWFSGNWNFCRELLWFKIASSAQRQRLAMVGFSHWG